MIKYSLIILIALAGCQGLKTNSSSTGPMSQTTRQASQTAPSAKSGPGYQSLRALNHDTLNYVKTSFIARKEYYEGKNLDVLLNDLEIPVKSYLISDSNLKGISPNLVLQFFNSNEVERKRQKKLDPVIMTIIWETPLPMDSVSALNRKNKAVWTEDERHYFGKQKVKNVGIVQYNFN